MKSSAKIAVLFVLSGVGTSIWLLQGRDATPPQAPANAVENESASSVAVLEGTAHRDAADRSALLPAAKVAESLLEHGFAYALDVEVIDRTGLPVVGAKVLLAPIRCRLDEVAQRTDDSGKLHVEWRGRSAAMAMVIATTASEQRDSMCQLLVQSGSPRRIVLGGRRGSGGATLHLVSGGDSLAMGGMTFMIEGGSGNTDLNQLLSSIVLQQSSFDDNPKMRAGLHPFASFGDVQLLAPVGKKDSGATVLSRHGLSFNLGGGEFSFGVTQPTEKAAGAVEGAVLQPARIAGIVYGEDGKPVARCPVCWGTDVDRPKKRTETDEAGVFKFDSVPEGKLELRAGGALAGMQHAAVSTARGVLTKVIINLKREITVRGNVIGEDNKPVPGCRIEWVGTNNLWNDSATSQQDGAFWITNLPGGEGQLLLWSEDDAVHLPVAWITVLPDSTMLTLHRDSTITSGQIVLEPLLPDGCDKAAIEARIFQEETGRGSAMAKIENSNQFSIQHLAVGWYHVELGGPGLGWVDAGRHYVDGKNKVDLGRLQLLSPGTARLQLPAAALEPHVGTSLKVTAGAGTAIEGQPSASVEIYVRRADTDVRVEELAIAALGQPLVLAPGDYFVMWKLESGETSSVPFKVTAGSETLVTCPAHVR
ncbi:MAG: carboxypeptidase-like regulatory domain-containing protein [Planctomycetota bacterium]|nr:carboxypeptidase-like regulatory domain-containing protein [Planctomycetota bacterium]